MAILLGIDTGGTYTDAVLFGEDEGVVDSAKALTTKYDLSIGIGEAVESVLSENGVASDIRLVSLSTTLATNAIVEGQGSPICVLLLGYPRDALDLAGLRQAVEHDPVVFVRGGHTVTGEEQWPLGRDAVRQAILTHAPQVEAFAVSGYFAVRNPAHELAVREMIRDLTGLPVTCGHELTTHLNAPRRALTAALNARLVPVLHQLIQAVRAMLGEQSIQAPLMVVKGDGSLVSAQVALDRPVETILSGPAASVVGARYLSGEADMMVIDMGGTTTDIAMLRHGRPVLNAEGATVGGWRTMVEAVAIHTFGLGGDSQVQPDEAEPEGLVVGPRRVVPLSLLAHQYPEVLTSLRRQAAREKAGPYDGQFAVRQRPLHTARRALSSLEMEIWDALEEGPVALSSLLSDSRRTYLLRQALSRLVERGFVAISTFTPTDVAHVLGFQRDWSEESANLGADLWCRPGNASDKRANGEVGDLCQRVVRQITVQAGRAVVGVALTEAYGVDLSQDSPLRRLFLDRALAANGRPSVLDVSLSLHHSLVAIGAPVATYYPAVAERLNTRLRIPPHAAVANAVGAVAGGVMQTVRALVRPLGLDDDMFRAHLPAGIRDFSDLEEAVAFATTEVTRLAESRARQAGAAEVQVQTERRDDVVCVRNLDVYLGTEVVATAAGRPRLADRG